MTRYIQCRLQREKCISGIVILILKHNSLIIKYAKICVNYEAKYLIEKLNLRKLYEEGGYYRETYRSEESILINSFADPDYKNKLCCLSEISGDDDDGSTNLRPISTMIYYRLDGDQFSAFHKVRFHEIWHLFKGSGPRLYLLTDSKKTI